VEDPSAATSSRGVPLEHDRAAAVAAVGPEVDHPVGVGDHVEVVLDDDHRAAAVDEPVEQPEQVPAVGHVQPRSRLVEHVHVALLVQPPGQLEPLALAAGQGGQRLAQGEVAQPDVDHRLQPAADVAGGCGRVGEELHRVRGRHVQRVGDGLALDGEREHLLGVAAAVAVAAGGADAVEVGQVGVDRAEAVAGGAGARGVEAEQRRFHPGGLGVELADGSITPVQVAGVERIEVATADWSTTIASGCWGTSTSRPGWTCPTRPPR
jgi:hypothetical protein